MRLSLLELPIEVEADAMILGTLGAGGCRDAQRAMAGAIDYDTDHDTCFQFRHDWRSPSERHRLSGDTLSP